MSQTALERIAALEARLDNQDRVLVDMRDMIKEVRDTMLTDDGKRKGYWKVVAVSGGVLAALGGFATFWHEFGESLFRR